MKKIFSILKPIIFSYMIQVVFMILFIIIYLVKHDNNYELDSELYTYLIIGITLSIIPTVIYLFKKNKIKEEKIQLSKILSIITLGIGVSLFYNMLVINIDNGNKVLMDLNIIVLILYTGILGPIFEEILFRYVVLNRGRKYYSKAVSIILVSLIFALLHTGIINMLYAFILGLILAYIYLKYKNIIYPIIIHISANLTSIFLKEFNIYLLIISIIILGINIYLIRRESKQL